MKVREETKKQTVANQAITQAPGTTTNAITTPPSQDRTQPNSTVGGYTPDENAARVNRRQGDIVDLSGKSISGFATGGVQNYPSVPWADYEVGEWKYEPSVPGDHGYVLSNVQGGGMYDPKTPAQGLGGSETWATRTHRCRHPCRSY